MKTKEISKSEANNEKKLSCMTLKMMLILNKTHSRKILLKNTMRNITKSR